MTVAYVNHGRWVAECDTPYCQSAEMWWPGGQIQEENGKRFGLSGSVLVCGNCGLTHPVVFPRNRKRIEVMLARRPVPETRNWYPTETVDQLAAENVAYGTGV